MKANPVSRHCGEGGGQGVGGIGLAKRMSSSRPVGAALTEYQSGYVFTKLEVCELFQH